MRLATRHAQAQLTRGANGKFLVGPELTQPRRQQQQQQQQQQHQHQQPSNEQAIARDEVASAAAREPQAEQAKPQHKHQVQQEQQQTPAILADRFLLLGPAECSGLMKCVDLHTGQQLVAKALQGGDKGTDGLLQAQMLMEDSGAVADVAGLVEAEMEVETESKVSDQQKPTARRTKRRYLLLDGHHGDLHAYVRSRRRLREPEARRLFCQAARAVASCHRRGVVLRDLKLRKFVFADEARTELRLESLEDAVLVDEEDDLLSDRRGCPAYVAPEVLRSGRAYSGKAADMWSLGVLLYTMLVGRYPFNDTEHATLFAKISRAHFQLPEALSPRARCLIRALLRRTPHERPLAADVLQHPWLSRPLSRPFGGSPSSSSVQPQSAQTQTNHCLAQHHLDQLVPDFTLQP